MVHYLTELLLGVDEFRSVLERSTLGERRPVDDEETLRAMLDHANLVISCRDEDGLLIGVARSLTDYRYCCYLSDLAVDVAWQKQGIGKGLIEKTRQALGPDCKIILLAAPAAADYYAKVGFTHHPRAWVME